MILVRKLLLHKIIIIGSLLFLLSRFVFLRTDPIFFDSTEYLNRLADPSFTNAISSGHIPLHAGYIALFWPIYHLSLVLKINPSYSVVLFQVILSALTVCAFYTVIKSISNKKLAAVSGLIMSFLPLFWITNVTIMMETVYIWTFIFSFYFLTLYFKKEQKLFLVLSSFFLAYSLFTHLAALLYLPLFAVQVFLVRIKKNTSENSQEFTFHVIPRLLCALIPPWRENVMRNLDSCFHYKSTNFFEVSRRNDKIILTLSFLSVGILAGIVAGGLLITHAQNIPLLDGINIYLFGKLQEKAVFSFNLVGIAIYIRNWIIPLIRNNTNFIVGLAFVSLVSLFQSNKKLFVFGLFWIAPSFVANQWWDSVFFGRHALLSSFGIAFLAANFAYKYKLVVTGLIIYLLITTVPVLSYLKGSIPYIALAKAVSNLPKESLYIESHFARPQIQEVRQTFNTIYVDEPGWQKEKLKDTVEVYLKEKKKVFISSQALSEPYGLYSGPYLHSLSLSYKKPYVLQNVISEFGLGKYKTINEADNLFIYEVVSSANSPYPSIPNLKHSARRLDYYDPLSQLWFRHSLF